MLLTDIKTLGGAGFASQCTNSPPDPLPSNRYSAIQFTLLPNPLSTLSPSAPSEFVLVLKTSPPETRPDGRIESRISQSSLPPYFYLLLNVDSAV